MSETKKVGDLIKWRLVKELPNGSKTFTLYEEPIEMIEDGYYHVYTPYGVDKIKIK